MKNEVLSIAYTSNAKDLDGKKERVATYLYAYADDDGLIHVPIKVHC